MTIKGLDEAAKDVERISEEAVELLQSLNLENPYLTWLIQELVHRRK